jgi:hypothetical protein
MKNIHALEEQPPVPGRIKMGRNRSIKKPGIFFQHTGLA